MTEHVLQKVHVFPSMASYQQNAQTVGADDLVFIPAENNGSKSLTFTSGQWSGGTLRIAAASHGRQDDSFGFLLRQTVSGVLRSGTWAVMSTGVSYEAASGDVVLTSDTPYDGAITFFS